MIHVGWILHLVPPTRASVSFSPAPLVPLEIKLLAHGITKIVENLNFPTPRFEASPPNVHRIAVPCLETRLLYSRPNRPIRNSNASSFRATPTFSQPLHQRPSSRPHSFLTCTKIKTRQTSITRSYYSPSCQNQFRDFNASLRSLHSRFGS